jgi:hypothetical protein
MLALAPLRAAADVQRLPAAIDPCAIFAKSPITRCIDSNVEPPDETTPCIADTTFFI